MNIVLLSRKPSLYSTRRLREVARLRKHEIRVVDPLSCVIHLTAASPGVYRYNRPLRKVDVVIPRIGLFTMSYGLAVLRQFEGMGVPTMNGWEAIARTKDKLGTLQILSQKGFPIPDTLITHFPRHLDDLFETLGGPPLILKLPHGTQGMGVIKADSREAAESVLDTLWSLGQDILLQKFIAESEGKDLRVLVIGDRVVGAMRRRARAGEFRSNIHRGGTGEKVSLPRSIAELAVEATRTLGLRLAGVDLLESHRGPLILEVNSSPGFQGLEEATRLDIAGAIIDDAVVLAGGGRKPAAAAGRRRAGARRKSP